MKKPLNEVPVCLIDNATFSWVMRVDGMMIPFSGGDIAEYFADHYKKLGYKIVRTETWLEGA